MYAELSKTEDELLMQKKIENISEEIYQRMLKAKNEEVAKIKQEMENSSQKQELEQLKKTVEELQKKLQEEEKKSKDKGKLMRLF